MTAEIPGRVYLKHVRIRFSDLLHAKATSEDGRPKFGATFLIDPSTAMGKATLKAANAAVREVYEDHWDGNQPTRFKEGRKALIPADEFVSNKTGQPYSDCEGMVVVKSSASEDDRPTYLKRDKKQIGDKEITKILFNGAIVECWVRFYGVSDAKKGGNGVFCYLEAIRFMEDDGTYWQAGGPKAGADDFDDYEDDDADADGEEFPEDDDDLVV